jgi:hypothetical protein
MIKRGAGILARVMTMPAMRRRGQGCPRPSSRPQRYARAEGRADTAFHHRLRWR